MQADLALLFDTQARPLLRWFRARTMSGEVSADLVAETFAAAIESWDSYDSSRGDLQGWLWGIARNLYRQYLRHAAVERRARERLGLRTPPLDDEYVPLEDRLDAQRAAAPHLRRLQELSPKMRMAFELRVLHDLPYQEVASVCDCSVGAARVRVSRVIALLADESGFDLMEAVHGSE